LGSDSLLAEVRNCRLCADFLPLGPRPVLQVHPEARILIVGQAPGSKVHRTGIPFDDPSGDRLREWLGLSKAEFYDERIVAILPMGFCYPGTGKSGDLPPRPECAPKWRAPLLSLLTQVRLTVVIGKYAQDYHLQTASESLTDTVSQWRNYWPSVVPLPRPSPRNNIWISKNPWFTADLLPLLRAQVEEVKRE
jgi:uracil-DNA glycosylase